MKFLVIGAGAVGTSLCSRLVADQHDVTMIERNEANVDKVVSSLDLEILYGNGCSPELLVRAGIHTADYVIAVASIDEVNVTACLAAKLLNPNAKRIARIRDIDFNHAGIPEETLKDTFDLIINPDHAAAQYLLKLFQFPGAKEVVDFCDGKLRVLALEIKEGAPMANKALSEFAALENQFPMLVISIVRGDKLIVPRGNDVIKPGDVLYFITVPEKTSVLFEATGSTLTVGSSAMIWGGGSLGRALAQTLEQHGVKIKLIVSEDDPALEIIDELKNTLVLAGDGKDQQLLEEENIGNVDAFIAATSDEEDNILSSLLAKKLGVRTSMALVDRATYSSLVSAIGVDVAVSARIAAATEIFHHIHSESVISEFSMKHLNAGFIEIAIDVDSPIANKALNELKVPHGIIISAIVRGREIFIPRGDAEIYPHDRVVIFVTRASQKKLEKLLDTKMEFFV
jgi:trk system potassium uptake protein TrkA